jgi:hypothetical protein
MRDLERIIRELGTDEVRNLSQSDYLAACGISERQFREECLRIATSLPRPFDDSPSAFKAVLAKMTHSQTRLRWQTSQLRRPNDDKWPTTPQASRSGTGFPYATIYALKGRQAPAIALILPALRETDDGVKQWHEGRAGEARRVLYVGASRAEKLLIIAAHQSIVDAVKNRLNVDAVPLTLALNF